MFQTDEDLDPEVKRAIMPHFMNQPTQDTSGIPNGLPDPNEVKRQAAVALEQKHQTGVPGIAGPNMAAMQPAATLPGVQLPEPQPNAQPAAPAIGSPTLATSPVGPPGVNPHQARQVELNKGSGIDQFSANHHIAGPILKALDIAGSVFAPNLSRFIPGTTLHHDMLLGQNEHAIAQDTKQAKEVAETAHANAETNALNNPKPQKAENPEADAYAVLSDPNSTPEQRQAATNALNTVKGAGKEGKTGTPEEQVFADFIKQGKTPEEAFKLTKAAGGKPGETHTAEDIRSAIADAYEQGNPKEVARLQAKLKAVGDPYAGTKIEISQQAATDRHDAADQKKKDALAKETKPLQTTIDEAETAHNLQKMAEAGNAAADVDLALSFFKMMRGNGGQGIRFTQQEQNLIMGARNSAGDLQAMAQKVIGQGQKFTPEQRKQIVDVIDMHAKAAKSAMERMQGGQSAPDAQGTPQFKVGDKVKLKDGSTITIKAVHPDGSFE